MQFDFEAGDAQWSPEGRRIKFWNQDGDLEILDLNTKQKVKLSISQLFYQVYASDWSPDGKAIALVGRPSSDRWRGLYVIDARESPDPRLVWECEYECNDLHWLSSKEQIVIAENLPATDSCLLAQIVKVNVRTGESAVLFPVDAGIARMNWSPDETQVAVVSYRKGIFIFSKNGEQQRMIANDGGGGIWSPDSMWLAINQPVFAGMMPTIVVSAYHFDTGEIKRVYPPSDKSLFKQSSNTPAYILDWRE